MMDSYYLGVYWKARQSTLDEFASKVDILLKYLSELDHSFLRWFKPGYSLEEALSYEVKNIEQIKQIILDGNKSTKKEVGFRLSLWNGIQNDGEGVKIKMMCGNTLPLLLNSCVISLPYKGDSSNRILNVSILTLVMQKMIETWCPEWGVVGSHLYQDTNPPPKNNVPRSGWMVYLSKEYKRDMHIPSSLHCVSCIDEGVLMVLTRDKFNINDPVHVELANQIADLLEN
jgi:Immunity protein 52